VVIGLSSNGMAQSKQDEKQLDRDEIFAAMDLDKDKRLSEDEYASGVMGKLRKAKNEEFTFKDSDGDKLLSFDEFKSRKSLKGRTATGVKTIDPEKKKAEFANLDEDKNGVVSLTEFVGKRVGSFKDDRQRQFLRLNVDRDENLTLEEFSVAPGSKPSLEAIFNGLDQNKDGLLTPSEFNKRTVSKSQEAGFFGEYDQDRDGSLSKNEYILRDSSLKWKKFWRLTFDRMMSWGTYLIVAADIILVWFVVRKLMNRRQSGNEAVDKSSATAGRLR